MSWSRLAVAVPVVLAGLCAPAPAPAAVLDGYQELASRYLTPAPLVPTTVPPSLASIDETLGQGSSAAAAATRCGSSTTGPPAVTPPWS
jgi:hypothetical protein